MVSIVHIDRAARTVHAGGVIAYPTEAVYGLGCLPEHGAAVERLLEIKGRPKHKGFVLIGADIAQLQRYAILPEEPWRSKILASWPGPVTWVLEAQPGVPAWITGRRDTVAVRLTDHDLARRLCRRVGGALISTSANVSRRPPLKRLLQVRREFGRVDYILAGPVGTLQRPTLIRDGLSGAVLRSS